jgi:hypothetical protein
MIALLLLPQPAQIGARECLLQEKKEGEEHLGSAIKDVMTR